jgi:hypothetical protein
MFLYLWTNEQLADIDMLRLSDHVENCIRNILRLQNLDVGSVEAALRRDRLFERLILDGTT